MAVELCSEKSPGMVVSTPRISFSYDFIQSDVVPIEQRPLRSNSSGLNSSIDFDFCVRESFELESSTADELFSDGKILPTEIKKKGSSITAAPPIQVDQEQTPQAAFSKKVGVRDDSKSLKKEQSSKESNEGDEKQSSKSFWRFKRSSSCGTGYGRTLCPLPLLSRSNSTGSADESSPINIKKEGPGSKQNTQKSLPTKMSQSHSSSSSYQKPPLKKSFGAYNNGVSINPVLNVPPTNIFGIGSMFSNGKNKNKKK
ncbi:hypothetical protein UlMin_014266 [Ulmus minor]